MDSHLKVGGQASVVGGSTLDSETQFTNGLITGTGFANTGISMTAAGAISAKTNIVASGTVSIAGGYSSNGVTIAADGSISSAKDLKIDGTAEVTGVSTLNGLSKLNGGVEVG